MTEQQKEQQYVYHTDQQVSVNTFMDVDIDGEVVRFQVTNRYGATAEKIAATVDAEVSAFKMLRAKYPRPVATVPAKEPRYTSPEGDELPEVHEAVAGRLSVDMKDGKAYFKIMDASYGPGKGTKYGVTVWPETLKAAGLNVEVGQPVPEINGWHFEYVLNEKGYPQKVTRLLPPKK